MDLEMIQDLLGTSNLPPPPSVQDLLGDVVPIARSPSPPSASFTSLRLSVEHSYSKPLTDPEAEVEEPMDHQIPSAPGSQNLASLSSASDCYESFLLNLLKVYTQNRMDSAAVKEAESESNSLFTIDSISPEAIDSLSQDQVQSLVTSSSMNYDVVHQILAYRQRAEGGVDRSVGTLGDNGVESQGNGAGQVEKSEEAMSALQQLQALQLTPEQLKQIQLQMAELIRTKQIVLPTELSLEQQQQLLQSLILKQVHMQHQQGTKLTPTPSDPPTSTPADTQTTKSTGTQVKVGSTLAAMLSKDTENQETGGVKTVKIAVPPPSNIGSPASNTDTHSLQLSSNPVANNSSPVTTSSSVTTALSVTTRSGGRRKKDAKEDEPKKPSQPYGIFFSDVYPTVLQANPKMSFSEASKIISMMWNAMGADTKQQYYDRSGKQKEEYQAFLESRKSETLPSGAGNAADTQSQSDQVQNATEEASATKQTVQIEATATQQGLTDVLTSDQMQKPPTPLQPKLVVKDVKHCVNDSCFKDAVYTEFRGPRYCSNDCVVQHCRSVFQEWVTQRKLAT